MTDSWRGTSQRLRTDLPVLRHIEVGGRAGQALFASREERRKIIQVCTVRVLPVFFT